MHDQTCFITLTYSDEHLPADMSLDIKELQRFKKTFRKHLERNENGKTIRFFECGEYGDETRRPHYHAIIFGYDFPDKKFYRYSKSGEPLYTSSLLERVWGKGHCPIGAVTFESAAYVARYQLDKRTGPLAKDHYAGRKPEFANMSRRPGIGKPWLDKWCKDVYPRDYVVVRGKKMKPPKYYDRLQDDVTLEAIKVLRQERASLTALDNTKERLAVKEEIQRIKQEKIIRGEI